MQNKVTKRIKLFLVGFLLGVFLTVTGGIVLYKGAKLIKKVLKSDTLKKKVNKFKNVFVSKESGKMIVEDFRMPIEAQPHKTFGKKNQLTFELFRSGTFTINGASGYALQRSPSYRDSAFIRSTKPLPKTYKVSVVVGDIDYGLEKIKGLAQDPEYPEGPQNENGCYLLTITDEPPKDHHTNIWWHKHRKVVIDVDNNVWGQGMPNPIFMVYFDGDNKLKAFDGAANAWTSKWEKGVTYQSGAWYTAEVEKTESKFILRVYNDKGNLLKEAAVPLENVWHADDSPDYLVVGEPHENYYQGSMKIRSIALPVK